LTLDENFYSTITYKNILLGSVVCSIVIHDKLLSQGFVIIILI